MLKKKIMLVYLHLMPKKEGATQFSVQSINTIFLPSAVSRAGDDLSVTDETTAGQVTCRTKKNLLKFNLQNVSDVRKVTVSSYLCVPPAHA